MCLAAKIKAEAEKARWEREGQWLARLTGRNLARRGDFLRLFPKI